MKVLCIADIHGSAEEEKLKNLKALKPDLILVAGDITNFGGRKSAEKIINSLFTISSRIYAVPGNCDTPEVLQFLEERGMALHGKSTTIGAVGIFGAGGSPRTPFATPFELSEEEISHLLQKGYEEIRGAGVKILLSHSPPFGILDRTSAGVHAGSMAVRKFIEEREIDYVICGHIHEASGAVRFNDTVVINTGKFSQGCYLLHLQKREIERITFR